jgi:hypothetical protein
MLVSPALPTPAVVSHERATPRAPGADTGVTDMKTASTRHGFALCILLAAGSGIASAGETTEQIGNLAAATGLTSAEVKMVLGARTPYFEYLTSYARAQKRLEQVLGPQRYRDLMAGREIVLDDGQRFAFAAR